MQTAPDRLLPEKKNTWFYAWSERSFRVKFILVWLLIFPLLAAFHLFFIHIEKREGIVLNDWLLEHIPVHNASLPVFVFIWGAALLAVIRCVKNPRILLLMLWTYLLVSICRILCIWMIPLNAPPHLIPLVDPLTNFFYGKHYITKDLFFSGHTSSVFIVFFGLEKKRDKIFILISVICIAVLLLVQHVHYTIDILAAPVATFLCFRLAKLICAQPLKSLSQLKIKSL
ncbi:MAG: phosphatase PAP2-related protein [Bacteroidota bacterium]